MEREGEYSIKVVARRTGLSPHVIRVWERRYGAVAPDRSITGRRLYSDAEIERLQLLQSATSAGHSIGRIAQLSNERLAEMVKADRAALVSTMNRSAGASEKAGDGKAGDEMADHEYLNRCIDAMERLDAVALDSLLRRAVVDLGQIAAMDRVVVPLVGEVGERWRKGSLRVAQEHLASAVARAFLTGMIHRARTEDQAPNLIVTTPSGQLHELGALMVAATAAGEGWRVTYLGPNLPAEEIAAAALHSKAKAVALSLVYPTDDARLGQELRTLRDYLPPEVVVLVGGRAMHDYAAALDEIGAIRMTDLHGLRTQLEMLRSRSLKS